MSRLQKGDLRLFLFAIHPPDVANRSENSDNTIKNHNLLQSHLRSITVHGTSDSEAGLEAGPCVLGLRKSNPHHTRHPSSSHHPSHLPPLPTTPQWTHVLRYHHVLHDAGTTWRVFLRVSCEVRVSHTDFEGFFNGFFSVGPVTPSDDFRRWKRLGGRKPQKGCPCPKQRPPKKTLTPAHSSITVSPRINTSKSIWQSWMLEHFPETKLPESACLLTPRNKLAGLSSLWMPLFNTKKFCNTSRSRTAYTDGLPSPHVKPRTHQVQNIDLTGALPGSTTGGTPVDLTCLDTMTLTLQATLSPSPHSLSK